MPEHLDVVVIGTEKAVWQIKDFSVALRAEILRAAQRSNLTVANWLHEYFHRHGIGELRVDAVKVDAINPTNLDELEQLARIAATLALKSRSKAVLQCRKLLEARLATHGRLISAS